MHQRHIPRSLTCLSVILLIAAGMLSACSSGSCGKADTATESARKSLPATEATTEVTTETTAETATETTAGTASEAVTETITETTTETAVETEPASRPASMSEEVFATLCGVARFSGTYTYDVQENDEQDARLCIDTVFAREHIRQMEYDPATGDILRDHIYGMSEGYLTLITRDIHNVMQEIVTEALFESRYNPFDRLSAADLLFEEDGVYVLSDKEKARTAAMALTGRKEDIAAFRVYVENGVAVRVVITTAAVRLSEELSYVSVYDLAVTEHGTAAVDPARLLPYEHTADHDELEAALEAAQASGSFTIRHQERESGDTRPGYGDTDYFVYVLPDLLWDTRVGEEHGFKLLNGSVYPFDVDAAGKVILHDPMEISGIEVLSPHMTDFKVELFRYLGDGVYTLHDPATAAAAIAPLFAVGNERISYGDATDFTIKLSGGRLWQVVFTCKTSGVERVVTLTYDFDSPINLNLDFEAASPESVPDDHTGDISIPTAYCGIWEYTDFQFHDIFRIRAHTVFCNDEPLTLISYTESEGITAECRVRGSEYEGQTFNLHLQDGVIRVTLTSKGMMTEQFIIQKTADEPGDNSIT